jgi:hypothetical protein
MLACNSQWGCEEKAFIFLKDFQKQVSWMQAVGLLDFKNPQH